MTAAAPRFVTVKSHQGHVLINLARHYPTIPLVILEIVQNAIDAGAKRIAIEVNKAKNFLSVCDDGAGASREQVKLALQSVATTMKDRGKYGQFGIGLVSPLAVSGKFTFTSCPTSRTRSFVQYTFVTKEIENSYEVNIPEQDLPDLEWNATGKIWWRTRIEATKLTRERRPSTVVPKDLALSIALKFGEAIRSRNIDIKIEVTDEQGQETALTVEAPQFKGTKLAVFTDTRTESGEAKIELFIARAQKGGRKGVILFGSLDNPSRITAEQFVRCAKEILDPAVAKVIVSGVFEGTVLCKKISLHPDRTRFEDNDALFTLCEILETWHGKIGKQTYDNIGEESQNEFLQDVGLSVMPFIELLAEQPQFAEIMNGIKVGTVGKGHARVSRKLLIGDDAGSALSTGGGVNETRKGGGESDDGDSSKKPHELKSHVPAIVYGPKGKPRTEVRSNSTGLRLQHLDMEDFRIPFEFIPETGTISINTNHPYFGQCQRDKASLQQYHGVVATIALSLELHRDKSGSINPELVAFAHSSLENHVFGILNGKALIG